MKTQHLLLVLASTSAFYAPVNAYASQSNANFNGFASIAYTDSKNHSGYAHIDDGNFFPESVFGLQGSFTVDNNIDAVVQVTARGDEEWELDLTMAYIGYEFANGIKARGGVIRVPLFLLSEYLEVGYAQPWARSPYAVYGLVPIHSVTGIDVQYEYELSDSYLAFQGYTGSQPFEHEGVEGDLSNAYGVSATWYDDELELRLGYNMATADSRGLNTFDEDASFLSAGARYDNGRWLAMLEYTQTRISNDKATALYPENDAGYLTLGYRVDSLVPYISFSHIETKSVNVVYNQDGSEYGNPLVSQNNAKETLNYDVNTYSIGTRWDIKPGLALKGDVTYVDFLGTSGGIVGNDYEEDFIYTVKLDLTF